MIYACTHTLWQRLTLELASVDWKANKLFSPVTTHLANSGMYSTVYLTDVRQTFITP